MEKEKTKTIPCNYCFYRLFQSSTGITSVCEYFLPATTLATECCRFMFQGCSSLTTAPDLPATTLADGCYSSMFDSCSSLTTAPDLPATSLAEWCYYGMFYGCSSLNSIKIVYTGNYDYNCFVYWVSGVAYSGTFYYNGNQTAQDFQLLSGWTTLPF